MTVEVILIASLALVAAGVALRSPLHAFWVLIAALPFESALAYKGPLTILPAYLAVLMVAGLLVAHPTRHSVRGSLRAPMGTLVLVYVLAAASSLIMTVIAPPPEVVSMSSSLRWRVSGYRSVMQFALLCFSAGTFFLTVFICSTAERLRFAIRLFVVVSALTALYGLFQMAGVWYRAPLVGPYAAGYYDTPASLRPNATFQEPMNLGHFLLASCPVVLALFLHERKLTRTDRLAFGVAALPLIAVMLGALFLTIGRAAWLGFGVAVALVFAASDRSGRRRALGLCIPMAIAAIPFALFAFGSAETAWTTVANRFRINGATLLGEQRLWYFPFLLGVAREYPILGVGYGNYPVYQVFAFGLGSIAGAYGVFWQALVETGVIGFGSLLAMVGGAMLAIVRTLGTPHSEWRPYLVGWLGAIAGLATAYFFFGDRFSLYMWVALGLAMATVRQAREPVEPV